MGDEHVEGDVLAVAELVDFGADLLAHDKAVVVVVEAVVEGGTCEDQRVLAGELGLVLEVAAPQVPGVVAGREAYQAVAVLAPYTECELDLVGPTTHK